MEAPVPLPVSSLSTTEAGSAIASSSKLSIRIPALSSIAQASKKATPQMSALRPEARQTRSKKGTAVMQQAKIKEPPRKRTKLYVLS